MFNRYEDRITTKYRVPEDAKYLLILPELDVKSESSPSIKKWIEFINNNSVIPREYIHISFFSEYYGIIPLELSNSFPMGQYESVIISNKNDYLFQHSIQNSKKFLLTNIDHYKKYGILIPDQYINQFQEQVDFFKYSLTYLSTISKSELKLNILSSNNLAELLEFFKR